MPQSIVSASKPATAETMIGSARPRLSAREFEQIRRYIYEAAGIDLQPGKEDLVAVRLGRFLVPRRLRTFEDYLNSVKSDKSGALLVEMIDALATNHTGFFRESAHFEFLRKAILPALRTRPRIEIWSAASSTGEEPFSVAMAILEELGPGAATRIRVFATDISTKVLAKAKSGVYAAERVGGVPRELVQKYFVKSATQDGVSYALRPELRSVVDFQRLNLMEPVRHGRTFPLILLRNVMIYFDRPTQEALISRLALHIEPGGHLFIGHSESLTPIRHGLQYVQPAIYRKAGVAPR